MSWKSMCFRLYPQRSSWIYLWLSDWISANRTGSFFTHSHMIITRDNEKLQNYNILKIFNKMWDYLFFEKFTTRVTACLRLIHRIKDATMKISVTCRLSKSILILIIYRRLMIKRFLRKAVSHARYAFIASFLS